MVLIFRLTSLFLKCLPFLKGCYLPMIRCTIQSMLRRFFNHWIILEEILSIFFSILLLHSANKIIFPCWLFLRCRFFKRSVPWRTSFRTDSSIFRFPLSTMWRPLYPFYTSLRIQLFFCLHGWCVFFFFDVIYTDKNQILEGKTVNSYFNIF